MDAPRPPKDLFIDKSQLKDLINSVAELDESVYTKETWVTFEDTLSLAKMVILDEEVTQEEVDKVLEELEVAISNLIKVEEPGEPKEPEEPEEPGEPEEPLLPKTGIRSNTIHYLVGLLLLLLGMRRLIKA